MSEQSSVQTRAVHNVIMENRRMISLSGVRDVDSFEESNVVIATEMGELTVKGDRLHISRFDQATGEMLIDGEICELIYADAVDEPQGFWSRLFR